MKLLDDYFKLQNKIYKHFEYVEDWKVIPLEDGTNHYWHLFENKDGSGHVIFAESVGDLKAPMYSNRIYTQRFLPKWVYRAEEYTMISVDTNTDGNKFLQIFDNKKEVKNIAIKDLEIDITKF